MSRTDFLTYSCAWSSLPALGRRIIWLSPRLSLTATGKGKGLAGRETVVKTTDLSQIVSRTSGTVAATPQKRTVTLSMEQLSQQAPKPTSQKNGSTKVSSTERTSVAY